MGRVATVQAIENAAGVHLYAFDAEERCLFALTALGEQPAGSLPALMLKCIGLDVAACGDIIVDATRHYERVTEGSGAWEIIAEHDGENYSCYEESMGREGLRLAASGYVLGLLHTGPEGNWFEHAGEGSIWQYTFPSPVIAEQALDEVGLDCEIHAIPALIKRGCKLDGMAG